MTSSFGSSRLFGTTLWKQLGLSRWALFLIIHVLLGTSNVLIAINLVCGWPRFIWYELWVVLWWKCHVSKSSFKLLGLCLARFLACYLSLYRTKQGNTEGNTKWMNWGWMDERLNLALPIPCVAPKLSREGNSYTECPLDIWGGGEKLLRHCKCKCKCIFL